MIAVTARISRVAMPVAAARIRASIRCLAFRPEELVVLRKEHGNGCSPRCRTRRTSGQAVQVMDVDGAAGTGRAGRAEGSGKRRT
jgi:hypothetical protein